MENFGNIRQQGLLFFFGFWRRMKLERGTNERVFDGLPIWRSFQNWKNIFPIVFEFEKLEDTLESDISSRDATSFSTLSTRR